jgi:hypothetical protein
MEEERILLKVLEGKFHNTKSVGKQEQECVVQRDALQIPGFRHWRKRAEDTEEWRRYLGTSERRKFYSALHRYLDGYVCSMGAGLKV